MNLINLKEARRAMEEFEDENPETFIELFVASGYNTLAEVERKISAVKDAHPGWVTLEEGWAVS